MRFLTLTAAAMLAAAASFAQQHPEFDGNGGAPTPTVPGITGDQPAPVPAPEPPSRKGMPVSLYKIVRAQIGAITCDKACAVEYGYKNSKGQVIKSVGVATARVAEGLKPFMPVPAWTKLYVDDLTKVSLYDLTNMLGGPVPFQDGTKPMRIVGFETMDGKTVFETAFGYVENGKKETGAWFRSIRCDAELPDGGACRTVVKSNENPDGVKLTSGYSLGLAIAPTFITESGGQAPALKTIVHWDPATNKIFGLELPVGAYLFVEGKPTPPAQQ